MGKDHQLVRPSYVGQVVEDGDALGWKVVAEADGSDDPPDPRPRLQGVDDRVSSHPWAASQGPPTGSSFETTGTNVNLAQLLNGVALGALLMILSSGLAMIYGLRGVMNFSHGALYMLGAYLAYAVTTKASFWLALIIAPLGLAVVGAALELGFFRRLQNRSHIEVGLVTFGLALVIDRIIVLIWGDDTYPGPGAGGGQRDDVACSARTTRPTGCSIIGIAAVLALALVLWLNRSRPACYIRAASHDTETSSILGVNTDRVSLVVVCLGAALAGLAGTLAAPYFSVQPGMGQAILITVLIVVVVGGIGSIGGAMVAGLALGVIQIIGNVYVPSVAVLVPYMLLIVVLLWRPTGLAGKRVA